MKVKKIVVLVPARDLKKQANAMACCKTGPAPLNAEE